ncbi:hypothetical protein MMC13_004468 [Lambiella insularis]|nr:hypothetical protein [Lambiella insularis]
MVTDGGSMVTEGHWQIVFEGVHAPAIRARWRLVSASSETAISYVDVSDGSRRLVDVDIKNGNRSGQRGHGEEGGNLKLHFGLGGT